MNEDFGATSFNTFPYDNPEQVAHYPSDINPTKEYVWHFPTISTNQDVYEFPQEEFNLGLKIEKQKNNIFNILDVAEIDINNLKADSKFYSKLMN